jgi:hypothetical protein
MSKYTAVIDFYEQTELWGKSRWFNDVASYEWRDGILCLRASGVYTFIPLNSNIANITITKNDE